MRFASMSRFLIFVISSRVEMAENVALRCAPDNAAMPPRTRFAKRRAAFAALAGFACALAAHAVPAADWTALARVHDEALRAYQAAPAQARAAAATRACEALERAGIVRALAAPVADVTPRRAAQILDDDGFLAGRSGVATEMAEPAIRRALARGIQGDDPADPHGGCDLVDHYLRDGKRTLVERREGLADLGGGTIARSVLVLERGRQRDLCVSEFPHAFTVTPLPPPKP